MAGDRRLLLVHAHPDDETINNGATMARYAAEGVHVALLTCTLGEFGEILVPQLRELEWDKGNQLGGYRMLELERAMASLGVGDHRFLGAPGRFHDSGMMGTPGNDHPRAFWRAADRVDVFATAVRFAVSVIRRVRPQVVVTYDENGGYGHPDHIMAHRVTMAAVDAAADPNYATADPTGATDDPTGANDEPTYATADPHGATADQICADVPGDQVWSVSKVYWNVLPRSVLERGLDALRRAGTHFASVDSVDDYPFVVEDRDVTTVVNAGGYTAAKSAAMRAHATQISVDGPFFALSNNLGMAICGTEHYRLVRGMLAGGFDADGHETDLFAGVA